jgi:5-methylcytosine-specific restriction endonuclease McrA/transcription elongation factor Elf1
MTIGRVSGISYMHFLPCLRCGSDSVGVSLLSGASRRENVWCLAKECEAVHYLRIAPDSGGLDVAYGRYTRGDPLEAYDEGGPPAPKRTRGKKMQPLEVDGFSGPVAVYPPKRHFNRAQVHEVWKASKGRCQLCGRRWSSDERGPKGWQIDHVIPNAGAGAGGKQIGFRLACANCSPRKGRGDRHARLLRSIRDLVMRLTPSAQR